ncbi:MAG: hypothetical protein ABI472_08340 [Ginsengibacter sp.]
MKTDAIVIRFLQAPLYNYNYEKNFGTLYTAKYDVTEKKVNLYWPEGKVNTKSFDNFIEEHLLVHLSPGHIKNEYL